MSLPLKVLGDRVLVKPDINRFAPTTTESGVIVAATLAAAVTGEDPERSVNRGTVVAVGTPRHPREGDARRLSALIGEQVSHTPQQRDIFDQGASLLIDLVRRKPCCAVGDDVLFASDAGQLVTLSADETYLILRETDLFAVIDPETEAV